MVLCHDDKLLVCAHYNGLITVINTEEMSVVSTSAPFEEAHGTIDNFCNIKKIKPETASGLYENIVFASSKGLLIGMLMQTGEVQISDRTYFFG